MERNEFKSAARRLAKTVHTHDLIHIVGRHLNLKVDDLLAHAPSQPIDFARAAEWLSQALYGKSWNVVSGEFKALEARTNILDQWLACKNEQEAIEFLLARSDLGEGFIVSEMTGYNEEPMDDGRGFPRMRVSYQLVFDKPGNPRGEYAIYIDGNHGGLVGWEALDENGDYILFSGSDAFESLLGKPHPNMHTFADLGLKVKPYRSDAKPNRAQHQTKQRLTDFCTTPVDDYATFTYKVGGGEFLVKRDLVNQLPEVLRKYRADRQEKGSLASEADFNTGFMAAVLAILGEEAVTPGLVLNSRL